MGIKDDFIQVVDDMIQSPFVRKIKGVVIPNGDPKAIQRETEALDKEAAKGIYDSAFMLSDVRNNLEKAKAVIIRAGQECPEQCTQALVELLNGRLTVIQEKVNAAQREFDALPKVDEVFMEACRKEEQKITAERDAKKAEIQESGGKIQQAHRAQMRKAKIALVVSPFMVLIGLTGSLMSNRTVVAVLGCLFMCGLMLFLISLMMIPVELALYKRKLPKANKEKDTELARVDKLYNTKIADIHAKMERGYSERSDFSLKLHLAELNVMQVKRNQANEAQKLANFQDIIQNFYQEAPLLLQRTIDNLDSLVLWATNYMNDKKAEQHYNEMQSIEKKRLSDQEEANRKQEEILQKQADAAQETERYAKEQAAAAAKQAKDIAEIKRRMEWERYGDSWKSK